jgi:hypothetical protein
MEPFLGLHAACNAAIRMAAGSIALGIAISAAFGCTAFGFAAISAAFGCTAFGFAAISAAFGCTACGFAAISTATRTAFDCAAVSTVVVGCSDSAAISGANGGEVRITRASSIAFSCTASGFAAFGTAFSTAFGTTVVVTAFDCAAVCTITVGCASSKEVLPANHTVVGTTRASKALEARPQTARPHPCRQERQEALCEDAEVPTGRRSASC